MHDALKVIAKSKCVHISWLLPSKGKHIVFLNAVIDNINVVIPVWSIVFMVEANGMTKFMKYDTMIDTTKSYNDIPCS